MKKTFLIAERELMAYLRSPLGYIVIGMFLLLVGFLVFFPFAFLVIGKASVQPLFNAISPAWRNNLVSRIPTANAASICLRASSNRPLTYKAQAYESKVYTSWRRANSRSATSKALAGLFA